MSNESTSDIGNKSSRTITGGSEQVVQQNIEEQPYSESEGISKDYRVRPNVDKIPCPFLASAYNNGDLRPAPDGTLSTKDLDDALAGVGVGDGVRSILVRGADNTDDIPDSLNLFKLQNSSLAHSGNTGIRSPKVDPQKLDLLLSFGENGKMYEKHFAIAANEYARRDPGLKGTITETPEFTSALLVFGRVDESGDLYLTNADIEGLWLEGRYPQDWKPRPPDSIRLGTVALRSGLMLRNRAFAAIAGYFKRLFR